MSKEKEIRFEEELEDSCSNSCGMEVSVRGLFGGDCGQGFWDRFDKSPPEKIKVCESMRLEQTSVDVYSSDEGRVMGQSGDDPQDADYPYVPALSDELENLILARVPRSEYWKFCFVNKRYLGLLKTGELFKIRREIGVRESSVFMLASGESCWWSFDRQFTSRRMLPILPSDTCFTSGDKESLCAGTHLIVSGREIDGVVIWRYELTTNRWYKGPSMRTPRCLFASATCGNVACVAGGIGMDSNKEVLNSAEKYNPENKKWEPLPRMHRRRRMCSGCYMDSKFYVLGGRNEHGDDLRCAEVYDEATNTWELIPEMLRDVPVSTSHSPPLVAVVNNELYALETSSNQLQVYLKRSKSWKKLGPVPVRADFNKGWGVAFKSLGNELLVIGASSISYAGHGMTIYTCCPYPDAEELNWKLFDSGRNRLSHFILNCSVIVA
ncbi:Kelch repeat type 1 [Dillenia turbinata]|uniref:Kelch repeat type 1 n=1 Tax=Dillenia turbinata TaxID=194707 RepID=A0AAN8ZCF3_9MAGN